MTGSTFISSMPVLLKSAVTNTIKLNYKKKNWPYRIRNAIFMRLSFKMQTTHPTMSTYCCPQCHPCYLRFRVVYLWNIRRCYLCQCLVKYHHFLVFFALLYSLYQWELPVIPICRAVYLPKVPLRGYANSRNTGLVFGSIMGLLLTINLLNQNLKVALIQGWTSVSTLAKNDTNNKQNATQNFKNNC